jgi:MFS family permease
MVVTDRSHAFESSRGKMMLAFYRQLFTGLPREVWFLSTVTFVYRSGTMVLPFLTLYLKTQRGFSAREAGGVLSLYGVGSIGGSYLGGVLSDRLGPLRTQFLGLILTAGSLVLLSAMQATTTIVAVVILMSIFAGSLYPSNAAALAAVSPPSLHVRVFGLRRLSMNLGMSIGPTVGGLLVTYSYQWLFFVEASVCVTAAVLLYVLFRHPLHLDSKERSLTESDTARFPSPYRDSVFLVLIVLTTLLVTVLCQLFGAYPLTLTEIYGLPEYAIGLVFTLNTLVIVVFQMPIVRAVEHFDVLRVVGVGSFLLCLGFSLLSFASSPLLIGMTVLVWTLGEMLTTPMLEGFVATRSRGAQQGQYMGLFSSSFSMAFVLAPVGGTWLYEEYGYRTLWWTCGMLGVVLWSAFSLLSLVVRKQRLVLAEQLPPVSSRILDS